MGDATSTTIERAKRALGEALVRERGEGVLDPAGPRHYTAVIEDNLVDGIPLDTVRAAFAAGAGHELASKMRAAYSSSALAINSFAPWLQSLDALALAGRRGFRSLNFEVPCSTGLRGTAPHLDVVVEQLDTVVAIESKCLEPLSGGTGEFSSSYEGIVDERASTTWFRQIAAIRANPKAYRYLDAAQLTKHALGLARTYSGKDITLMYVYWEPVNADQLSEYQEHNRELERFKAAVAGERVQFVAQSYPALWATWELESAGTWRDAHLRRVRARYEITI